MKFIKKIMAAALSSVMAGNLFMAGNLTINTLALSDESLKCGEYLYYNVIDENNDSVDDYIEIVKCDTTAEGTISIPSEIDSLPVKVIGKQAFVNCSLINGVTIPDSIDYVKSSAFLSCTNLEAVTFSDAVHFASYAFSDCKSLNSVYIPDLTVWCNSIFDNALANPLALADNLYVNNVLITDFKIPNGVKQIGDYAFYKYKNIKSIEIPETVTYIGTEAFSNCTNISDIKIPDSVTEMGSGVFLSSSLKSVEISDNIEQLNCKNSAGVFTNCRSLENVKLPLNLKFIGDNTFKNCEKLNELVVPETVESIGKESFSNTGWLEIKRSENPLVIVNDILVDGQTATGEIVIPDNIKSICPWAFNNATKITKITMPDGVTSIGEYAFASTDSLKSINIPQGVTKIEKALFMGCDMLESITFHNNITQIGELAFYYCKSLSQIDIPKSVNEIGNNAFISSGLTSITIPSNIKTISIGAFSECDKLADVTISEGVEVIDNYAFSQCASLEKVEIPESVVEIGKSAFGQCKNLSEVTIKNPYCAIASDYDLYLYDGTFSNEIDEIYVAGNLKKVNQYGGSIMGYKDSTAQEYAIRNSVDFIILNGTPNVTAPVTTSPVITTTTVSGVNKKPGLNYQKIDSNDDGIYDYAKIIGCNNPTGEIVIPQDYDGLPVKVIGESAFDSAARLEKISIPDTVETIETCAFYGCISLKSIKLSETLVNIESRAFESSGLTEITLPSTIQKIGTDAFKWCKSLTKLIISDGVERLDSNMEISSIFYDPGGEVRFPDYFDAGFGYIRSVYIPKSLKYIGYNFFESSKYLTDVYFDGTKEEYAVEVEIPYISIADTEFDLDIIGNKYYTNAYFHYSDDIPITEITTSVTVVTSTTSKTTAVQSTSVSSTLQTTGSSAISTQATTVITENVKISGDANGDSKLDVRDCAYIASTLANGTGDKLPLTADFNCDGIVNVRDAAAIAKWLTENNKYFIKSSKGEVL